jgi:uncharacterized protein
MEQNQAPMDSGPSRDECVQAMLVHALGATVSFIAPLIIRMRQGNRSAFVYQHATEALNYQITIAVILLACWNFAPPEWFPILLSAYIAVNAIFCIPAMIAASGGKLYRYWLSLRLIG